MCYNDFSSISVGWLAEIESSFKPPLLISPISQHFFYLKDLRVINLDYSRVEIAAKARRWPTKL